MRLPLEAQESLNNRHGALRWGRSFTREDFKSVLLAFEKQFGKPMPVSAQGETVVHRALGFDHRDRVDVAIFPDTAEGLWLRR